MSADDRLTMLDEFGSRARIIPAEVRGVLRTWRNFVHGILLLILLVLPWIRINGMQAVLLDIPARRFELFGILFLSHDAPLLFFIAMLAVLLLVIVTALYGRVWCGWACPQTVFIDAVYRRIEILVEGTYLQRRKLAAQPMHTAKAFKLAVKWFLYFVVSSLITHSIIAYFAGAGPLLRMMQNPPGQNWGYFVWVTAITALLMFNFGWFREQFCVIMCPYGRFQSVLMDQQTVTVMYDSQRGEPRRSAVTENRGDCVSCNRCVQVCPTKIDIRDGVQMECISCTACIDACNEIMRKVNKPPGLIRHRRISGNPGPALRPRILAYITLCVVLFGGLIYTLQARKPFSLVILRGTDMPYQVLQDGRILNHFKNHYLNQSVASQDVEFALSPEDLARGMTLTQTPAHFTVPPGGSIEPHFFVSFPRELLGPKGEFMFRIMVRDTHSGLLSAVDVRAAGPYSGGS